MSVAIALKWIRNNFPFLGIHFSIPDSMSPNWIAAHVHLRHINSHVGLQLIFALQFVKASVDVCLRFHYGISNLIANLEIKLIIWKNSTLITHEDLLVFKNGVFT